MSYRIDVIYFDGEVIGFETSRRMPDGPLILSTCRPVSLDFYFSDIRGNPVNPAADTTLTCGQLLLTLQESELDYASVLSAVTETIPPHSIVYFLSMSHQAVPDYISVLEEQDCSCFWIYAPPENFPPVTLEGLRIVDRAKAKAPLNKHCMPDIADFTTGPEILERRSGYEKI